MAKTPLYGAARARLAAKGSEKTNFQRPASGNEANPSKEPLSGIFAKVGAATGLIAGLALSTHYLGVTDPYGLGNTGCAVAAASICGGIGEVIDKTAFGRAVNNLPRTIYNLTH